MAVGSAEREPSLGFSLTQTDTGPLVRLWDRRQGT